MKYISIFLMLLFASACQTPTRKGKFTWQDDTSTQERTIASQQAQSAKSGEFIYLKNKGFGAHAQHITPAMSYYCDSSKSFVYVEAYHKIICVKK